ncbi:ubiquitin-like domain-containing protein [Streptomyces sp. LP11]|uniref:Ubiquitin-like domain-containing protein n=2 Tax=Streptomyces pyxinicus TaxID=2970331 RepID=A0ABT2AX35_9ACTN|nr:resuscitation-promoting factor [Streptomyces sp. LP11]MCS0600258.1 ubiquitin-like domain-containing protein [Streptomyces sp. LP11]
MYADTYRPGYERPLPRQSGSAPTLPAMPPLPTVPVMPPLPTVPAMPGGAVGEEGVDGRAARRRKGRPGERSESALRRLLPQALVVAFLAGGTTAFVAEDKAIELSVDGHQRTLHTFAGDVGELLAEQGVPMGEHDMVAPAPGAALASGDEVAVRYGRPVRLTLDGSRREVWTTAHTVEGALDELGVRAQGAYLSASRSRSIGRAGLALDVRTERAVTIMADGRARTLRTNAANVGEAVREAGITLRGQDTTSVPLGSFPRDGQTVTVLRVTGARRVYEEQIPFAVERTADPTLFRGTEVVDRPGRPGLRRTTYLQRTVNGVRQKPRRERTEVVRRPREQLVRFGTKPRPDSVHGADHLNWQALAACESGGRPHAVDPSGTYGGLYQFDARTWHSLGGSGRPQDASAREQTYRAKKLYVRQGAAPWPHCGPRLHS